MREPSPPAFPFERSGPLHPPAEYRRLGDERPVAPVRLWNGQLAWLVTGYAEARAVLGHPAASSVKTATGFPYATPAREAAEANERSFIAMDNPEHHRYRHMLTRYFTVRQAERFRPVVQGIVDRLLDDLLAGSRPTDLVQAFAYPVATLSMCHLLGVPYEDHEFVEGRANQRAGLHTSSEEVKRATSELLDYVRGLIEVKLTDPGDDLVTALIDEQLRPGHLTVEELVIMLRLLLGAGHETTASTIAMGALALLDHPEQAAELGAAPSLAPAAVEEVLRYISIFHISPNRAAVEDFELGGQVIRAGQGIIVPVAAANRDGRVYPEPDSFDLHRETRPHLGFGFGVHQCLGQNLARVELQVVFATLFRRIPGLRLAAPDRIEVKDHLLVGVHELPVTWE
jgi:vitamin D 1,25-hydroxylase